MTDLRVDGLAIRDRHGRALLAACDFVLEAGRCLCLVGESGAGKSLVCAAIAGTLAPELSMGGRIWLGGREITAMTASDRRGLWSRAVFLLPQEPWTALAPARKTRKQVGDMPRLHGNGRDIWRVTAKLLERAGLTPSRDGAKLPSQLSGGMAQRAALATTFGAPARLILVDEPTKALDADRRAHAEAGLRSLLDEGRSMLLVTHDLELAGRLANEIVVMREGEIAEQGAASDVLSHPRHAFTRELLVSEPSSWTTRRRTPSPVLVKAAGLAVSPARGGPIVAQDLDFSIRRGGITGLSGPSGCGKTTLGDTLVGLHRPAAGTLYREGRQVVQKLYQDPGAAFAPWRSIRATLSDALAASGQNRSTLDDRCSAVFARLGLAAALLDRRPAAVSGGELQRLSLARALLCRADLIFADEPTSRLDAISQKAFMDLLCDVADNGTAIFLASHNRILLAKVAYDTVLLS